jgi:hypothetical protein
VLGNVYREETLEEGEIIETIKDMLLFAAE